MTAPSTRRFPNKWPGKCVHCGDKVPAYTGIRTRDAAGNWQTEHEHNCTAVVVRDPAPLPPPVGQVVGTITAWTIGDVTLLLSGDPGYAPRHAREAA